MSKIKITQVKSGIDRMERQKRTLKALGLRRMLHTVEHEATPQILGMVKAVHHLVKAEMQVSGDSFELLTSSSLQVGLDKSNAQTK